MAFSFKTIFSSSGAEKLKAAFAGALEPALVFAETGSKAASAWAGMKMVLMNNVLGPIALLSGALIGVIAAFKLVVGQSELLRKGMAKLKEIEFTEAQFSGLLGGINRAKERVKELYDFANSTPFQMGDVADASRVLEVLTKGALSTGVALKMVGDAAATAGADMQNVAMHVGRMYDGLQSGRPVGEAAARLQELGIMSGVTRAKIEAMTKAGNSFSEVWGEVEKELMKNEGGMKTLSKTLKGLETTLTDAQDKMAAGFAEGFLESEKESLARAIEMAKAFQEPLEMIGVAFGAIRSAGNMVAGVFLKIAGGAEGLSDALVFLIKAFSILGAGVLASQLNAVAIGAYSTAQAFLGAGKATIFFTTWNDVMKKGVWASIVALKGEKAAVIAMKLPVILMGGAFKFAKFMVKGFTAAIHASFKAMVAHPIGALLAAIAAIATALYFVISAYNKQYAAAKQIKDATRELTKELNDQASAAKNHSDVNKLVARSYKEMMDAAQAAGEATADIEVSSFGDVFDEGVQQADAMAQRVDDMNKMLDKAVSLDGKRLQLSKERLAILIQEYELMRAFADQEYAHGMAAANTAEKYQLMQERIEEIDGRLKEAKETRTAQVEYAERQAKIENVVTQEYAKQEIALGKQVGISKKLAQNNADEENDANASDQLRRNAAKEAMEAANKGMGDPRIVAMMDSMAKKAGMSDTSGSFGGDRGKFNRSFGADVDIGRLLPEGEQKGASKMITEFMKTDMGMGYSRDGAKRAQDRLSEVQEDKSEEIRRRMQEETGKVEIRGKVGNRRIDYSGVEDESEMGKLGALKSTIAAVAAGDPGTWMIDGTDLSMLEEAAMKLEKEVEQVQTLALERDKLSETQSRMMELQSFQAELRKMDKKEMQEILAITEKSLDAEQTKLEIAKAYNDERLEAAKDGPDGASTERAKKGLKEVENQLKANEARMHAIQALGANASAKDKSELKTLEDENLELTRKELMFSAIIKLYEDTEKATKAWKDENEKLIAKMVELETKAAKLFKRLKEDLEQVARDNEIQFRFDTGDINGAMKMMVAFGEERDRIFKERRVEELQKTVGKERAEKMAETELKEQQLQRNEKTRGNAAKAARELDIIELELAGRMGSPAAKKQARQMRERDFLQESLRKNLGDATDPVSQMNAFGAAASELMAKKMSEVPEVSTIADGFRSIGAGGAASSTDPQIIMARKRLEALKAIAAFNKEMNGVMIDTKNIIDERLKFAMK